MEAVALRHADGCRSEPIQDLSCRSERRTVFQQLGYGRVAQAVESQGVQAGVSESSLCGLTMRTAGCGFMTSAMPSCPARTCPLAGRLLGHQRHRTTAGYAHLADGHLVEAALSDD